MKKFAVKLIMTSDTPVGGLISNDKVIYPYPPIEVVSDEHYKEIKEAFLDRHPSGLMILCDEETIKMNGFDEITNYTPPQGEQLLCDTTSDLTIITESK